MFTGIVSEIGEVRAAHPGGDTRIRIGCSAAMVDAPLGASIACDGVCLTVVARGPDWFEVEASAETLSRTTLGSWREGRSINLERALRVGDELGGHLVSGHVDGLAVLRARKPEGDSLRLVFEAPQELMRFIAPKGSVTLSGVSLTVNEVDSARFGVNIIAHTQTETTLGGLQPGAQVNLEIDMLARYVARMLEAK